MGSLKSASREKFSSWHRMTWLSDVNATSHSHILIPADQAVSYASTEFSTGRERLSEMSWKPRWATRRERKELPRWATVKRSHLSCTGTERRRCEAKRMGKIK